MSNKMARPFSNGHCFGRHCRDSYEIKVAPTCQRLPSFQVSPPLADVRYARLNRKLGFHNRSKIAGTRGSIRGQSIFGRCAELRESLYLNPVQESFDPHLLLLAPPSFQRHRRPPAILDGDTIFVAQTLLQFLLADFFNGLLAFVFYLRDATNAIRPSIAPRWTGSRFNGHGKFSAGNAETARLLVPLPQLSPAPCVRLVYRRWASLFPADEFFGKDRESAILRHACRRNPVALEQLTHRQQPC